MTEVNYLESLNPLQYESVCSTEGPNLIIAGAGTGKTKVLTARVAHIIDNNLAFPSQILCVTFTNKAAREMSERVQKTSKSKYGKDALDGNLSFNWSKNN
jgi:DNA helicase-2/ATP-dependent DNA helicase PcrA